MSRQALIIKPALDPLLQCVVYGYFSMDEVLTIPSDQLEWIEQDEKRTIEKIIEERFPCDEEGFTRVKSVSLPRNINDMLLPCRPATCIAVFTHPAFNMDDSRHGDNKQILDKMYKAAKRRPLVLLRAPWSRRGRVGFVENSEGPSDIGDRFNVLRFDRIKWAEQNKQRNANKKPTQRAEVFKRGYVTARELRDIAEAMAGSVRVGLKKETNNNFYFIIELKFAYRTKEASCNSILNIYNLGVRAYGKNFWRRGSHYTKNWRQNGYVVLHTAKEVVARWKKEKREAPKDKKAKKIWDIIQDVAKARRAKNPIHR